MELSTNQSPSSVQVFTAVSAQGRSLKIQTLHSWDYPIFRQLWRCASWEGLSLALKLWLIQLRSTYSDTRPRCGPSGWRSRCTAGTASPPSSPPRWSSGNIATRPRWGGTGTWSHWVNNHSIPKPIIHFQNLALLWKRKTFVEQKAQLTILSEYVWVEEWDCKSLILWDSKVYIAVFKYIYEAICTVQVHYDNNIVLRFPQKQMIVCNVI